jgi:hypothetical protein
LNDALLGLFIGRYEADMFQLDSHALRTVREKKEKGGVS